MCCLSGADAETLLSKCLPLGSSPHLRSIMTFENFDNSDGLVELYRTVLVDTPVAPYFEKYFNSEVRYRGGQTHRTGNRDGHRTGRHGAGGHEMR